jgi:hypothetical protein
LPQSFGFTLITNLSASDDFRPNFSSELPGMRGVRFYRRDGAALTIVRQDFAFSEAFHSDSTPSADGTFALRAEWSGFVIGGDSAISLTILTVFEHRPRELALSVGTDGAGLLSVRSPARRIGLFSRPPIAPR